ncbi:hypothetical protein [Paraburkholderia sp. C35]|uniref:hypothetical protein n=1 Tax=Paraburkholderia sp. C35 TaxID=2126993 RepID=UPI0013A5A90B|nr:hypothetical protein [Paraburkholderia sp. C35]
MDNHLKNPEYRSLVDGIRGQINEALMQLGMSLPCHVEKVQGAMISVGFDVTTLLPLPIVTIPLFGPEYIRYPIKAGDLGVVVSIDTSIAFTCGTSPRPPNLSPYSGGANLEGLFFMPVGNKNWTPVDPAQVDIYAPNGVKLHDTGSGAIIDLHPDSIDVSVGDTVFHIDANSITATTQTFTINAPSIVLNGNMSQGNGSTTYPATLQGPLTVINDVTAAGKSLEHHEHSGVQPGSGNSGPPL